MKIPSRLPSLLLCFFSALSQAAGVELSPQGQARQVQQVTARFVPAMVAFGEPERAAPFEVNCEPRQQGTGRWLDAHFWVFDFPRPLPDGVRCEVTPKAGLTSLSGEKIETSRVRFDTGGPVIVWNDPYENSHAIDERQVFILALSAAVAPESLAGRVWCEAAGVGERIPAKLLADAERDSLFKARAQNMRYWKREWLQSHPGASAKDLPLLALQCGRPLPPAAAVKLVWGEGIAAPSGVATVKPQTLAFKTRPIFAARMSCTRANPKADCMPVLPIELSFNAPLSRAQLKAVTLIGSDGRNYPGKLDDEQEDGDRIVFNGPFPERAELSLSLPANLRDDAGRALSNARRFPLKLRTDESPPLAKFPARFGIIEAADPVLPVTLRNIEVELKGKRLDLADTKVTGKALSFAPPDTPEAGRKIIDWLRAVRRSEHVWFESAGKNKSREVRPGTRELLAAEAGAKSFSLPKPAASEVFEVVGIPLPTRGLHVVELASPRLGARLLGKKAPYYAQTAALVTNLSVHFKHGRESSLAWVTTLDRAEPVEGASVFIRDCKGNELWRGSTNREGIARVNRALPSSERMRNCEELGSGMLVSAAKDKDYSFVWTGWNEGLQPWRFNLPGGGWEGPHQAHAVLDRSLLRAGETVSMKLLMRRQIGQGFAFVDRNKLPAEISLVHRASDERFSVPVRWDARSSAEAKWTIPADAKLGYYEIEIEDTLDGDKRQRSAGAFRVEAFRVPTLKATLIAPTTPQVASDKVELGLQVNYLAGGAAGGLAVKSRAMLTTHEPSHPDFDTYVFSNGKVVEGRREHGGEASEADAPSELEAAEEAPALPASARLLKSQNLSLDARGAGKLSFGPIPASDRPQRLLAEVEYREPNGETSSSAKAVLLWPAKVDVGLMVDDWAATPEVVQLKALALDLAGKPAPGVALRIEAFSRKDYSHRKRLVGGFYAYQSFTETKSRGLACEGRSDAQGRFECEVHPKESGQLIFQATASDSDGRSISVNREVWVPGADDWWFKPEANDRIDLIAEKRHYEPGETARFQVRAPFREATVLVTVEREGVLESFVTRIDSKKPLIELPVKGHFAPNVFVSALVLRGRVDAPPPTALLDLAKPAFRLGIAPIEVGWRAHRLEVKVEPKRESYRVREEAEVQVAVRTADGQLPPKDTEVSLAVVDEGLLQLKNNESWRLLEAMMRRRGLEVETSTAQQEVIGKRHFGKKAAAPGGGGGQMGARELFDTLLLWQARLKLDEEGKATVRVPLNDSLTRFRVVAVAEGGAQRFGTGEGSFGTTQEVMLLSGLPSIVREGDRLVAGFTLRNTTLSEQRLRVEAKVTAGGASGRALAAREISVPAEGAVPVGWEFIVPEGVEKLVWELNARGSAGVGDRLRITQSVQPAVPVEVQQATLFQLTAATRMPVAAPGGALPNRGGLSASLSASLAGNLAGVREYMLRYPYTCTEQNASRAVALQDRKRWNELMARLPGLLDGQGLAKYFAVMSEGSEVLTSYLLQIAAATGWAVPEESERRMKDGLRAFVEGRVRHMSELPTADFTFRRLAAIAALSTRGEFDAKWLESVVVDPGLWPTSAVIDWVSILRQQGKLANRSELEREAMQVLRTRLNWQGTLAQLSSEKQDYLWWLMVSGDANINRLLLLVNEDPAWASDIGRLARGALERQQRGHWSTTTANAWGVTAFDRFAKAHERVALAGSTVATLGAQEKASEWKNRAAKAIDFAWPAGAAELVLEHRGEGAPWVTLASRAAVPLNQAVARGLTLSRRVEAVEQQRKGAWQVGDVLRVTLDYETPSDLTWVVLSDPLPPGAAVLGSQLGTDSAVLAQSNASQQRWDGPWLAFEERKSEVYRSYYRYVPRGKWSVSYLLRLNQEGAFQLPPSRVEAMYAPEMQALWPNGLFQIEH